MIVEEHKLSFSFPAQHVRAGSWRAGSLTVLDMMHICAASAQAAQLSHGLYRSGSSDWPDHLKDQTSAQTSVTGCTALSDCSALERSLSSVIPHLSSSCCCTCNACFGRMAGAAHQMYAPQKGGGGRFACLSYLAV